MWGSIIFAQSKTRNILRSSNSHPTSETSFFFYRHRLKHIFWAEVIGYAINLDPKFCFWLRSDDDMFRQSFRVPVGNWFQKTQRWTRRLTFLNQPTGWPLRFPPRLMGGGRYCWLLLWTAYPCWKIVHLGWSIESTDAFIRSDCMVYIHIMRKLFWGQLERENHCSLIISHRWHAGIVAKASGRAQSTVALQIARRRRQNRSITSAEVFLQRNCRKEAAGIWRYAM